MVNNHSAGVNADASEKRELAAKASVSESFRKRYLTTRSKLAIGRAPLRPFDRYLPYREPSGKWARLRLEFVMVKLVAFFLIAASCVAQTSSDLVRINPEGLRRNPRFTQVIVSNGLVVISGQAPSNGNGQVVATDFRTQAVQVFDNLKIALAAAHLDFSRVVRLNTYIVDLPHNIEAYRDVRSA